MQRIAIGPTAGKIRIYSVCRLALLTRLSDFDLFRSIKNNRKKQITTTEIELQATAKKKKENKAQSKQGLTGKLKQSL